MANQKTSRIIEKDNKQNNRVKIKSSENGHYMAIEGETKNNALIYCKGDGNVLEFERVKVSTGETTFKIPGTNLYLNYRDLTGAVKLYDSADNAHYKIEKTTIGKSAGFSIKNTATNQYMWLNEDEPYITKKGDPKRISAQWQIEPV